MELDVTDSVQAFREILSVAWPVAKGAALSDTTGSFLDDWLQANWERVVEASIPPDMDVVLEPYGAGADCNISSSRVWRPNAIPTTPVFIRYIGNEPLVNIIDGSKMTGMMKVDYFCTVQNDWPVVDVPFDYVAIQSDDPVIIPVTQIRFYVEV